MKRFLVFFLLITCFYSCLEKNIKPNYNEFKRFLEKLEVDELNSLAYKLENRKSIDSLRMVYKFRIEKGEYDYYYFLASTYLEMKDEKGLTIMKEGARLNNNGCLLALAMYYENGYFSLIPGDFSIIPNRDSALYYYTIAANNNDMQSQYSLGAIYQDLNRKDSSVKYLRMCIENKETDESDLKGAARDIFKRYYGYKN